MFTTGSGLTLLAFQDPARLAGTMSQWRIADAGERLAPLAGHLRKVRDRGARIEPSAYLVGVTDISVPVIDHGGEAVGVLTCPHIEHPGEASQESRGLALQYLKALASRG